MVCTIQFPHFDLTDSSMNECTQYAWKRNQETLNAAVGVPIRFRAKESKSKHSEHTRIRSLRFFQQCFTRVSPDSRPGLVLTLSQTAFYRSLLLHSSLCM